MALHTDTDIYRTTYELTTLVTAWVATMPRNFRADFGAELRRRCMVLVMRIYEANTTQVPQERAPILQRMRAEVEQVNLALRLAVDHRLITHKQYGRAILLTADVGRQATGWQRHSQTAPVAAPSRRYGQRVMETGRTAGPQAQREAHQGYR